MKKRITNIAEKWLSFVQTLGSSIGWPLRNLPKIAKFFFEMIFIVTLFALVLFVVSIFTGKKQK
jgi:hypothetical protein